MGVRWRECGMRRNVRQQPGPLRGRHRQSGNSLAAPDPDGVSRDVAIRATDRTATPGRPRQQRSQCDGSLPRSWHDVARIVLRVAILQAKWAYCRDLSDVLAGLRPMVMKGVAWQ